MLSCPSVCCQSACLSSIWLPFSFTSNALPAYHFLVCLINLVLSYSSTLPTAIGLKRKWVFAISRKGIGFDKELQIFVFVIFFCETMSTVTVHTRKLSQQSWNCCKYFRENIVINLFAEISQKMLANKSFRENMQNFNVLQICVVSNMSLFYMLLVSIFVFFV